MNILIAEDQTLLRDTLRNYLIRDGGFHSIHSVVNGAQAVAFAEKNRVDCILMDIRMPVMDGLKAARLIKERAPGIGILILTLFENESDCLASIEAGCDGYLLKDIEPETLISSIRLIAAGVSVFKKEILKKSLGTTLSYGEEQPSDEVVSFTENELAVIRKVCEGKQNKIIASELNCSLPSVKNRIASVLSKTNLSDRTQIVIYALKKGLLK